MDKFLNKYRIPSARLQNWDYGSHGAYFVTICTHERKCSFGTILENTMQLSPLGIIADILWYEIKNHAQNVELGEFVIMPNHMHGIIILNDKQTGIYVETRHALPNPQEPTEIQTPGQKRFQNQGKNTISSIIGGYKSAVTKHANRLGFPFKWQARFHDHIIRDDAEYERIAQYILDNPVKWQADKFFVA